MNFFANLRLVSWVKRGALALERIADIEEEKLRRGSPATGTVFRTGYRDRSEGEGALLTQSDEELADLERIEREEAIRGFVEDEDGE